jgi:hypothetical protein
MGVVVVFTLRPLHLRFLLDRKVGGARSRSALYGRRKFLTLAGLELPAIQCPTVASYGSVTIYAA